MARRQNGVALVEFALILPFLLLLSMISIEVGRALWAYNTLTKSARDAARYLSLQTPGTSMAQARNLVIYGNRGGTGTPLAYGLNASHVPDPVWGAAGAAPVINTVTVRITGYTFTPMFAGAFGVSIPTVTFPEIRATMRSYL